MPYPGLKEGISVTAKRLGMSPLDLATIMSYETGGTFNPAQTGPTTKWGQHQGLIQFGQPQARQYGADFSSPQAAIASQLSPGGAVERYFQSSGWKPGMGLLDAYSIVNAGGPGRYDASDAAAGGAPGTVRDKVMNQFGPHQAKAAMLLGLDPSALGVSTGAPSYDPGAVGTPMFPMNSPNGPVPQYTQRQGLIQALMRGELKSGLQGMFSPQEGANPRLEAERFGRLASGMGESGKLINAGMMNTNAPISWSQVLGSVLSSGAEGYYEGQAGGAQQEADTQLTQALGQQMTPERLAQVSALDPELGQKLMMDQRGFDQSQVLSAQNYQRQQELLNTRFGQDVALEGIKANLSPIDPTALQKNLEAAGYTPGTPEYEAAMRQLLAEQDKSMGITGYDAQGRPLIGMTGGGSTLTPPGGGAVIPPVSGAPASPGVSGVDADPNIPVEPGAPAPLPGAPAAPESATGGVPGQGLIGVDEKEGVTTFTGPEGTVEQENIPGGKRAAEVTAEEERKKAAQISEWSKGNVVLNKIDEALNLSNKDWAVGLPGALAKNIPGSRAVDLSGIIDTINANLGFERLQEMRDNSPTGGALGQVTEKEIELLQSTLQSINQNQSKEQFQQNLSYLKAQYRAILTGENYEQVMGFPPPNNSEWAPATVGKTGPASMREPTTQEEIDAYPSGTRYRLNGKVYEVE